jgi:hypothetical protein
MGLALVVDPFIGGGNGTPKRYQTKQGGGDEDTGSWLHV